MAVAEYKKTKLIRGLENIENLFEYVRAAGAHIAGGFARWAASPLKTEGLALPEDIDIYSSSNEMLVVLVQVLREQGCKFLHESAQAVTLEAPNNFVKSLIPPKEEPGKIKSGFLEGYYVFEAPPPLIKLQLIKCRESQDFSKPQNILDTFDLTIVSAAILDKKTVLIDSRFLEDEKQRILRFKNISCPLTAMLRAMKYGNRGYKLPQGEAIKLFESWEARGTEFKKEIKEVVKAKPEITKPNYADPRGTVKNEEERLIKTEEIKWSNSSSFARKESIWDTNLIPTYHWQPTTHFTHFAPIGPVETFTITGGGNVQLTGGTGGTGGTTGGNGGNVQLVGGAGPAPAPAQIKTTTLPPVLAMNVAADVVTDPVNTTVHPNTF